MPSSETCAGCAALEARIAALEQRFRPRLSLRDEKALQRILPAIAGLIGSQVVFTVRELLSIEDVGLRLVLAGLSSKAIGKMFSRAAGVPVDGFVVERSDFTDHGAVTWAITGSLHTRETFSRGDSMRPLEPGD